MNTLNLVAIGFCGYLQAIRAGGSLRRTSAAWGLAVNVFCLVLTTALVGGLNTAAWSQTDSPNRARALGGEVHGTILAQVTPNDWIPVQGVTVSMKPDKLDQPDGRGEGASPTQTDAHGRYYFGRRPQGSYRLAWSKEGWRAGDRVVEVGRATKHLNQIVILPLPNQSVVYGKAILQDGETPYREAVRYSLRQTAEVQAKDSAGDVLGQAQINSDGDFILAGLASRPREVRGRIVRTGPLAADLVQNAGEMGGRDVEPVALVIALFVLVQDDSPGDELIQQTGTLASPGVWKGEWDATVTLNDDDASRPGTGGYGGALAGRMGMGGRGLPNGPGMAGMGAKTGRPDDGGTDDARTDKGNAGGGGKSSSALRKKRAAEGEKKSTVTEKKKSEAQPEEGIIEEYIAKLKLQTDRLREALDTERDPEKRDAIRKRLADCERFTDQLRKALAMEMGREATKARRGTPKTKDADELVAELRRNIDLLRKSSESGMTREPTAEAAAVLRGEGESPRGLNVSATRPPVGLKDLRFPNKSLAQVSVTASEEGRPVEKVAPGATVVVKAQEAGHDVEGLDCLWHVDASGAQGKGATFTWKLAPRPGEQTVHYLLLERHGGFVEGSLTLTAMQP
jgi:hypothetical protein